LVWSPSRRPRRADLFDPQTTLADGSANEDSDNVSVLPSGAGSSFGAQTTFAVGARLTVN